MKNHYAITITDISGSRHFKFKKSTKKKIFVGLGILSCLVVVSFLTNIVQHVSKNQLIATNQLIDQQLLEYDRRNSSLAQIIEQNMDITAIINQEVVEIERISGVDVGDADYSLEKRIRAVRRFYDQKELEYSAIGSKVEQIEDLMGIDETAQENADESLHSRVDLARINASIERILHDSIPNGYPLANEKITSNFGYRKHPITNLKSFHNGVDLRAKTAQKLYATADGIIESASYDNLSGNRIVLQHNFGFESRYSHLSEMTVEAGDIIHKGDLIGLTGNTGRSSAPHLHYEIRYLGKAIDPSQFLEWEFGSHEIFTEVRGVKWPSLISLINKQITHQTLQLSQLELN